MRRRRGITSAYYRGYNLSNTAVVNLYDAGLTGTSTITAWANADTDYSQATSIGTAANIRRLPSGNITLFGGGSDLVSVPDNAAIQAITGDLTIELIDLSMIDWTPAADTIICSGYDGGGFEVQVLTTGLIRFLRGQAGQINYDSSIAPTVSDGAALSIKIDFDLDNGSVSQATISTSTDSGGSWDVLGTPPTNANVTATATPSVGFAFGGRPGLGSNTTSGSVRRMTLRNGIGGTIVRDLIGTSHVSGTSIPDDVSGTWTLAGNARIQNTGYDGYVNIGSAGFESAAGQDLATYTFVDVMRFTDASPSANQTIVGSRSDVNKLFEIYTDNSNSNKLTVAAGGTPVAHTDAYDTDWHVISFVQRGGATSALSIDGVPVTGDPGTDTWDYGSMDVDEAGATSAPVIRLQRLVFNRALTDAELEDLRIHLTAKFGI